MENLLSQVRNESDTRPSTSPNSSSDRWTPKISPNLLPSSSKPADPHSNSKRQPQPFGQSSYELHLHKTNLNPPKNDGSYK